MKSNIQSILRGKKIYADKLKVAYEITKSET